MGSADNIYRHSLSSGTPLGPNIINFQRMMGFTSAIAYFIYWIVNL